MRSIFVRAPVIPSPPRRPFLGLPCLQAAATGAYKTQLPWWKIVLLGTVAGCYVGLGGALLLTGVRGCGDCCQAAAISLEYHSLAL